MSVQQSTNYVELKTLIAVSSGAS